MPASLAELVHSGFHISPPTVLPGILLMRVLKNMASAQQLPVELGPLQAGRKEGSRMHGNSF